MTTVDIETPHGPARAHVDQAANAGVALIMGHGAGGGVESKDIQTTRDVAVDLGVSVALVEQPYRVAGRRSPAAAKQLDAAWTAAVKHLAAGDFQDLDLVTGGRSIGARVACRTAEALGAVAVLCLAFPVQPPQRKGKPRAPDRLDELEAVTVPTLVVQGERDQFGVPPEGPRRTVTLVPGTHTLRKMEPIAEAVRAWLPAVLSDR